MLGEAGAGKGTRGKDARSGRPGMEGTLKRLGFTIVELLVVISIIGTLMALILPAVQSARAAARRTACGNSVAQLAKAMISYESQHGAFPSGGWGGAWLGVAERTGGGAQPGGWFYAIMPFCEEQTTFDRVAGSPGPDDYAALARSSPAVATCPSRSGRRVTGNVNTSGYLGKAAGPMTISEAARCDYAANGGSSGACADYQMFQRLPAGTLSTAVSVALNATACGGVTPAPIAFPDCNGCSRAIDELLLADDGGGSYVFCPGNLAEGDTLRRQSLRDKLTGGNAARAAAIVAAHQQTGLVHLMSRVTPAHVSDGLSNVYLVGEKYVAADTYEAGSDAGDDRPLAAGYSASSVRWGYLPPAADAAGVSRPTAFGSAHAGVWNVALADGSVRSVSYDISPETHRRLASRNDGLVAIPP